MLKENDLCLVSTDLQASRGFFFFQFCDVAEVAIIHKMI
jgi:hypothetical protein